MLDFLRFLIQPENLLFLASVMAFAGLWVLHIFGLAGDGLEAGVEGVPTTTKVPLIIFLNALFISFGVLGLFCNWLLRDVSGMSVTLKTIISTLVAGVISWFGAIQIATWLGKITQDPPLPSYVGCVGKVISEKITNETSGRISVTHDVYGLAKVPGRMAKGYEDLGHGAEIRVFEYDENAGIYFCVPLSEWPRGK
jgi:hypothetical protein